MRNYKGWVVKEQNKSGVMHELTKRQLLLFLLLIVLIALLLFTRKQKQERITRFQLS